MNDSDSAFVQGLGFGFFIGVIVIIGGCKSMGLQGSAAIRQEAVDAGAAEWTIDKEGNRGFRWLAPGKEPTSVPGK